VTSKKLGALLRSVPPATATSGAAETQDPIHAATPGEIPSPTTSVAEAARPPIVVEREVPLQVLIPANIRKQLALMGAEQGESLRSLILQAIRGLGVEVTDADIAGKRGRKNL